MLGVDGILRAQKRELIVNGSHESGAGGRSATLGGRSIYLCGCDGRRHVAAMDRLTVDMAAFTLAVSDHQVPLGGKFMWWPKA